MSYLQTRKMFLFDDVNNCLDIIENVSEGLVNKDSILDVNNYFLSISKGFVETIFRLVYRHVYKLKLNIFNESHMININHVRNIYKGILDNRLVKNILNEITLNIESCVKVFDIKKYIKIFDLIEELDFICMFEMYSYLLDEDVEGVLSFILSKILGNIIYNNKENVEVVNSRALSYVEKKLNLFKKIYDDEEITIVMKNRDHIIYKINNVVKLVQVFD